MHEGHFFLAVVVIIVAFFGLLIWAGIHGPGLSRRQAPDSDR